MSNIAQVNTTVLLLRQMFNYNIQSMKYTPVMSNVSTGSTQCNILNVYIFISCITQQSWFYNLTAMVTSREISHGKVDIHYVTLSLRPCTCKCFQTQINSISWYVVYEILATCFPSFILKGQYPRLFQL